AEHGATHDDSALEHLVHTRLKSHSRIRVRASHPPPSTLSCVLHVVQQSGVGETNCLVELPSAQSRLISQILNLSRLQYIGHVPDQGVDEDQLRVNEQIDP